jgi:hypothetical protein
VLLVKLKNLIRGGLGMEGVPIVVNVVVMFGRKVCKVEKRNIVNKGTAISSLIVRVMGISPNVSVLYDVADFQHESPTRSTKVELSKNV